jgi:hypothetical protein
MAEFVTEGTGLSYRDQAARDQMVLEQWEKSTLLEGLNEERKKIVSRLLENQARHLQGLQEDANTNTTSNIATYDAIVFPMVRRIFGLLMAPNIISVQPMQYPSGLLFYLDVEANTTDAASTFASVYEGLYDYDKVDRAYGPFTTRSGSVSSQVTTTSTAATLSYSGGYQGLSKARLITTGLTEVALGDWHIAPETWGADDLASPTINSTVQIRFPAGAGGSITANDKLALEWRDDYGTMEGTAATAMTELKLVISSTSVDAKTKKMKAHWTPELAQDMQAYHGMNAETELTGYLSEEVAAETDREILADLIRGAAFRATWNYDRISTSASAVTTQKEWNQTLLTTVNEVSAAIHKATLRGGANWITCSSEVAAVLDDLERFSTIDDGTSDQFAMGLERVGSLNRRYTVYKDPYMPSNLMLIGHKGNNFMEAGYVYAPYIPLQMTNVIYDADDFTPRKGVMTRFAKKMVNNKFYAVINVSNLNTYART